MNPSINLLLKGVVPVQDIKLHERYTLVVKLVCDGCHFTAGEYKYQMSACSLKRNANRCDHLQQWSTFLCKAARAPMWGVTRLLRESLLTLRWWNVNQCALEPTQILRQRRICTTTMLALNHITSNDVRKHNFATVLSLALHTHTNVLGIFALWVKFRVTEQPLFAPSTSPFNHTPTRSFQ